MASLNNMDMQEKPQFFLKEDSWDLEWKIENLTEIEMWDKDVQVRVTC